MKSLFFIFFTFLILSAWLAGLVSAATLSGSPSSLEYDLDIGEQRCLIFVVSSNDYFGNLHSIMKWAGKDAQVSSPDDFTLNNSEIELEINYSPVEVTNFDGEDGIEVCISGNEIGTWKGSLEYRTDSEGNIGIGVGTWLRVNVSDKPDEENPETQIPPASTNPGGSGGSGGGGGGVPTNTVMSNTALVNNSKTTETSSGEETSLGELEEKTDKSAPFGITGAIVEFTKTTTGNVVGIVFAVALIFAAFMIYRKNFGKK
jgi:hypothetical protein